MSFVITKVDVNNYRRQQLRYMEREFCIPQNFVSNSLSLQYVKELFLREFCIPQNFVFVSLRYGEIPYGFPYGFHHRENILEHCMIHVVCSY